MCLESCRRVKIYSNELFCWMLMDFHYYFSGFSAEDAALQRRREEASQEIARILPLKHKRFCSEAWLGISNRDGMGNLLVILGTPILRNSNWKAWMQRSNLDNWTGWTQFLRRFLESVYIFLLEQLTPLENLPHPPDLLICDAGLEGQRHFGADGGGPWDLLGAAGLPLVDAETAPRSHRAVPKGRRGHGDATGGETAVWEAGAVGWWDIHHFSKWSNQQWALPLGLLCDIAEVMTG